MVLCNLVPVEEDFSPNFEDGVKECNWSSFLLREHYLFCILFSLGWFTKRVECTRINEDASICMQAGF